MNNSIFRKTIVNIRNRVDIKLCSNEKKLEKQIAEPKFDSRTIFTETLAAIHMKKKLKFYLTNLFTLGCLFWISQKI